MTSAAQQSKVSGVCVALMALSQPQTHLHTTLTVWMVFFLFICMISELWTDPTLQQWWARRPETLAFLDVVEMWLCTLHRIMMVSLMQCHLRVQRSQAFNARLSPGISPDSQNLYIVFMGCRWWNTTKLPILLPKNKSVHLWNVPISCQSCCSSPNLFETCYCIKVKFYKDQWLKSLNTLSLYCFHLNWKSKRTGTAFHLV